MISRSQTTADSNCNNVHPLHAITEVAQQHPNANRSLETAAGAAAAPPTDWPVGAVVGVGALAHDGSTPGERLHQAVSELDILIKGLRSDPFVPSVGAAIVQVIERLRRRRG